MAAIQTDDKERWLKRWIRSRADDMNVWQVMHVEFPGKKGPRYRTAQLWKFGVDRMGAFRLARKYAKRKARRVKLVFVGETVSVWIGPDGSIEEIVDVRTQ